jgi:uncharacterized membrane protein
MYLSSDIMLSYDLVNRSLRDANVILLWLSSYGTFVYAIQINNIIVIITIIIISIVQTLKLFFLADFQCGEKLWILQSTSQPMANYVIHRCIPIVVAK